MDLTEILSNQYEEIMSLNTSRLCARKEEKELDLDSSLAQIVIGVRRSGKSTLCQKVLIESGVKFAYINFDDENLVDVKAKDMNDLMAALYRVYGDFTHLFIDEVQNVEGWPLFVNRLLRGKLHLVITGSNANLLSGELSTHLAGRYNQIELFPFSFDEYCRATNVDCRSKSTKATALRHAALDRYLFQGGFPELLNIKEGHKYVMSLLNAVLNKDICRRYNVRYKKTLSDMANGIVDHFCQEISYTNISKEYSLLSVHTAKNYIEYLTTAYLVCPVSKFSFKSTERQQARKYYVVDPAFISKRNDTLQTENIGWRLENVVAIELMRRMDKEYQQLYYLRKEKSFEVDFVVVEAGHVNQLIQVTYDFSNPGTRLYNREIGGLIKGASATECHNLTLVMMEGENRDIEQGGETIHCLRATDWLLGNNM